LLQNEKDKNQKLKEMFGLTKTKYDEQIKELDNSLNTVKVEYEGKTK
jgi:hypothetical protein